MEKKKEEKALNKKQITDLTAAGAVVATMGAPAMAYAADGDISTIKETLKQIIGAMVILLGIAALLLFALGHVTDTSGAKGQAAMITCVIGALACAGAYALVDQLSIN